MGYMHITNLYKDIDIMMFKECYALEKIHGTSAHVRFKDGDVEFFSGGEKHDKFVGLFDKNFLTEKFTDIFDCDVVVYGEAYGGKQQGMSETYGKELKFVVFDVKVDGIWLDVPNAADVANKLGLDFVSYVKISTNIDRLNEERDRDSMQAVKNGCGEGKLREGVVLRPLIEVIKSNGKRVIVKHKGESFSETKTKREVNPKELKILEDAKAIAEEWVTNNRLEHVLDHLGNPTEISDIGKVIKEMIADIMREAEGEIIINKKVPKAISVKCAKLYKEKISKI